MARPAPAIPARARDERVPRRAAPRAAGGTRGVAAGVRLALLAALLAAAPALAFDRLAVVAVAELPAGPDADLAELAHQVRAACRDRIGGVEDVPTLRARLLGRRSDATVAELDRAYAGALAVYQNGDFEGAIRTLRSIVDDLERLPESDAAHAGWIRAQLRLAQAALTIGREAEADEAMRALARTDAGVEPDADQYSPSYRRRFEQVKAAVRALPARRLQVRAEGGKGTVFVNGRPVGETPVALSLPAGTYRVGGASGSLRIPSFRVSLEHDDQSVVLDFSLAAAFRPQGGPGLALPRAGRSDALVRAGAWLGVDRIVAVSRLEEGDAQFLVGSIHDVRNGALLREGAVRMIAGSVPAANLGALAAFLITGQSSLDVRDRTGAAPGRVALAPAGGPSPGLAAVPRGAPAATVRRDTVPLATASGDGPARSGGGRSRWMRRGAYGSAALVGVFTGLAIQQVLAARDAGARADRMLSPDGFLAPGSDPSRYQDLRADARSASRNAYVSGGVAVLCAAAAGVLGWWSREPPPGPELAFRF